MKLTKYEHACLILDNDQSRLIIDPGCFSKLPDDLANIGCLIITEEHVDHFNLENVQKILAQNSDVTIFSTANVYDQLAKEGIKSVAIHGAQTKDIGGYKLSFYETDHAPIYKKSPCKSLSLKVDDYLFYPSDSYNTIEDKVAILALPTSGPWHKLEEAIELANAITSPKILATHNFLYSEAGQGVANSFIRANLADSTREFIYLKAGESIS